LPQAVIPVTFDVPGHRCRPLAGVLPIRIARLLPPASQQHLGRPVSGYPRPRRAGNGRSSACPSTDRWTPPLWPRCMPRDAKWSA